MASRLLFIFVRVSTGHAHFPNDEIRIPWRLMRPSILFFGCKTLEESIRKAGFKVCGRSLRPVFDGTAHNGGLKGCIAFCSKGKILRDGCLLY